MGETVSSQPRVLIRWLLWLPRQFLFSSCFILLLYSFFFLLFLLCSFTNSKFTLLFCFCIFFSFIDFFLYDSFLYAFPFLPFFLHFYYAFFFVPFPLHLSIYNQNDMLQLYNYIQLWSIHIKVDICVCYRIRKFAYHCYFCWILNNRFLCLLVGK